jgi:hypothetical protein
VIVLAGRVVAGPRLDGEDLDLIGAEYPAKRPERGELIPVDREALLDVPGFFPARETVNPPLADALPA